MRSIFKSNPIRKKINAELEVEKKQRVVHDVQLCKRSNRLQDYVFPIQDILFSYPVGL